MKIKKFNFILRRIIDYLGLHSILRMDTFHPIRKERDRERGGRPSIVENRGVWPCFEFEEKKGIKVEGLRMA